MPDQRAGGISWTDKTWNPIRGCSRVSEGCRACYAEKIAARFSGPGQPFHGLAVLDDRGARWTGEVRLVPERLEDPLRWRRPRRIFVNSMSDLFHEKLPVETIARVYSIMARAQRHTFQVLTKRSARMRELLNDSAFRNEVHALAMEHDIDDGREDFCEAWPLPNVWVGVSVEHQEAANERIPDLCATTSAVRWLSVEPMIGPVDLGTLCIPTWPLFEQVGAETIPVDPGTPGIDWVVCGGESGPGARPMGIDWARSLRDQCLAAGVPFHFKQIGSVGFDGVRRAKHANGRELDGRIWDEFPR